MKESNLDIAFLSRNLIYITFFLLFPLVGLGQVGKLFSTDAELSNSLINQIYQDDKGYIWIATEDGLARYDGAKFSIFKQKRKDSTSILNNYVKSIFQDSHDVLYFGFFNGLQYFDHATEKFHKIPLLIEDSSAYPAHVTTMLERKNGEILIGTSGQGILKLTQENNKPVARKLPEMVRTSFVEKIFEDRNENLWVLSQDKGLFKISKKDKINEYFYKNDYETHISSIAQDQSGNLYVGSLSAGLFRYSREKDNFSLIEDSENLPVKTLLVNKANEILVGTDGRGLKIYDPIKQEMSVNDFSIANFDFKKTKVHSIMQDRANNIWLGIYQKGVLLIPDKTNNFKYIGYQSVKNNIIGNNSVVSIFKDNQDILWVGTDGDGLYGITREKKQNFHLGHHGIQKSASIMSIFQDSENQLWIGTYLNGLAKINKKDKNLQYIEPFKDEQNNTVERIYSITEDTKKNLWIGTLGYGLYSYNIETETAVRHNIIEGNNEKDRLHNKWINCLLLSKSNKLYIGTYDGLSVLDLEKNSFFDKDGKNHILSNKIVYSLYEDDTNNLWIGTSEGLFYKPNNDSILPNYTIKQGLPSNVISAIEQDSQNNLWISTNNGISKFEPAAKEFTNYYFRDGLQGNEFNKNASYSEANGHLYFGSNNGVTFFDPSEITSKGSNLDLRITGFYIQDEPVKKGMKSGSHSIIEKAIIDADTIELAHNDNDFSIEFSSFAFKNQQWITYSYSLNSENWIKLRPGINAVTFNNLEPGIYNFKVRGKEYGEYSNEQRLNIIIYPPWYFSNWAKLAYLLLLIVISYVIVQEVLRRRKIKNELQEHLRAEQINESKLQFLTNISHDIKTPISLIINPLKKLIKTDPEEDRQQLYRVMERNSERILHLLNQLINARKIDQGKIELKFQKIEIISFVKSITILFEDQLKSKGIKFEINHPNSAIEAFIDPNHFDKIIQNLISNAIKFISKNGTIEVKIGTQENKNQFYIIVKDNGVGIKESELHNIFNRFYQISNDVSRQFEGTGIGLHLTKSIAELHHGTVKAENNRNQQGCTFIVSAPLGKSHLKESEITGENYATTFTSNEYRIIDTIDDQEDITNTSEKNKPTVLIVDDDSEIRNYIAIELKSHYNIIKKENGKLAVPEVISQAPDLIISDVVMPEMDGILFTRKIKKNIHTNHIPIILLTGKTDKETNLEGLEIGADAYINKPFNIEILKKTVKNLIKNRNILKNTYSGNQLNEEKIKHIDLKSGDESLVEKFMDVVNANISNSELNVEMVASELGISRVHLYRKLKQLTNQSAGELITNIRLKEAANLLISKNINIAEIAYAVGFSSTSKFSTKFKDLYGMSPTSYRKEHNNI
ncbi:two-component regulator propeller domain-containing protein [Zunongwangia endophytica]|uniref:histidine kinase n=1 Tax=Zunongwangia endophytica TaxID=1808945 RepID=A0ABV8H5A9_9FLAO|nr:two-component regulator propeller domain-containing protein [Zunongwangia endophytica]MDN3594418.1 two-component regulator propeller domain-containing protein [Zunongwangia endophytica]